MIFWKVFHVNLMLSCVASSSIETRIISLFSLLLRVNQLKFTHINSSLAQQNSATSAQQKTNIRNKHQKQQTQHENKKLKLKFKFIPQKKKRKKKTLPDDFDMINSTRESEEIKHVFVSGFR